MALTLEKGPLATTMGDIARRAGVQRMTLYRHFGDEQSLHRAAAQFCFARFPPPDAAVLEGIADPMARTRAALERLYAHWERMAPLARPIIRDADVAPAKISLRTRDEYTGAIRGTVARGFRAAVRRRPAFRDALHHAFDWRTWDSMDRAGFARRRAVQLMSRLVAAAAATNRAH